VLKVTPFLSIFVAADYMPYDNIMIGELRYEEES
jgi:hypothetical protein